MTPPVRGRQKARVGTTLVLAGTVTAALTGFAAGVTWSVARLPLLPVGGVLVVVGLALLADAAHRLGRGPAPLAVRRQVPAAWSSLFSPTTVALLYGARLGVGPLTLLPSWSWWAVLVAAASLGPGGAAVSGAAFGAARGVATILVAEAVRGDSVPRMARLVGAEPQAHRVLVVLAAGGCLLAAT